MNTNESELAKLDHALRELLIEASEVDLRDALTEAGETFDSLAALGGKAAREALKSAGKDLATVENLHRGLGALVQMLRRQKRMSVEDLADKANVSASEIYGIENNPRFDPNPRTIYQLEQYLSVPSRSLVMLSGSVRVDDIMHEEALRFAASAKGINTLNQEEKRELNRFITFLREHTDR